MTEHANRKTPHKGFYILPNLITTASLFAAFLCVTYAFNGNFKTASLCIFLSALFDGLDGKVARLTNTASQFGIEYDSLADVVAFGMAPALLAWTWQLHEWGKIGIVISFLFVACAALRLARFNVDVGIISKKFFIGLPSPAAGCTLAAFILFLPYLPNFFMDYLPYFTMGICIIVPLLMVSRVRYFSFKEFGFVKTHPFRVLLGSIFTLLLLYSNPSFWFFMSILIYLSAGIVYTYIFLPNRNTNLLRRLKHVGESVYQKPYTNKENIPDTTLDKDTLNKDEKK